MLPTAQEKNAARTRPGGGPRVFLGGWKLCACIKQSGPSAMVRKQDTLGAYTLGELAGTGRFGVVFGSGGGGAAAVAIKVPKDSSHARELADEEITAAPWRQIAQMPLVRWWMVPPPHCFRAHGWRRSR